MIEIYIRQDSLSAMSREELYVVIQTTRIVNAIKLFYTIAIDIHKGEMANDLDAKKYLELLFHQAANLYEILYVLDKDLMRRYSKCLNNSDTISELKELVHQLRTKDYRVEVLKAIRSKHSFHIGYDPTYIWSYIKEGPADKDSRIAAGRSIREIDFFYTMDIEPLFTFIKDRIIPHTVDVYREAKDIIDSYTTILLKLFDRVTAELLEGKIYGVGEKHGSNVKEAL